jgi:hypothetical protein
VLGNHLASSRCQHFATHLLIGAFIVASGLERWGVHKRMALAIVCRVGTSRPRLILGFMVASGFLSMWISNTATAVMMVPIGLGLMRLLDIALRREPVLPFQPLAAEDALPPIQMKRKEILKLDDYRDVRDDAIVVVNLIQPGTAEQQAADDAYTGAMIRGMAEGGYGPIHMGRAVSVEGEHRYKQFAAVYYPGIDHMHAMIGSAFINRIGPGKQLGDTLALATIPVLSKLDGANQ